MKVLKRKNNIKGNGRLSQMRELAKGLVKEKENDGKNKGHTKQD